MDGAHNRCSSAQNEWKLDTYLKTILLSLSLTKHILGLGARDQNLSELIFFKTEAQSQYNPSLMASCSLMALMFNQSKSRVLLGSINLASLFHLNFFYFYCHNSQLAFIIGMIESCSIGKQTNGSQPQPHTDPNKQAGFAIIVHADFRIMILHVPLLHFLMDCHDVFHYVCHVIIIIFLSLKYSKSEIYLKF